MTRLTMRFAAGRRTMRIPERLQKRPVRSFLGLAHPRRPARTNSAGRNVSAPRQPTVMAAASATPTV